MASDKHPRPEERDIERSDPLDASESTDDSTTTTGVWTSPKFGSAGSGGAELEPGPERD